MESRVTPASAAAQSWAMTVATLRGSGPLADSIRTVALAVVALLGALVIFVAAVFAVGLLGQRRSPYPM
jgi:hypothetical protein